MGYFDMSFDMTNIRLGGIQISSQEYSPSPEHVSKNMNITPEFFFPQW